MAEALEALIEAVGPDAIAAFFAPASGCLIAYLRFLTKNAFVL